MPQNKQHPRRSLEEIKSESNPVANFVREHRKYLGYTQEIFAKRVGVNLRFLKELELGKETLKMDKVNQVLNYLGARLSPEKYREED
jgi:predicted transcriptional regulator